MQHITIPAAIVVAGALIAGSIIFTSQPGGAAPSPAMATERERPPEIASIDESLYGEVDGFPSLGDPNAPVTIVEYSDYNCPFCKRFVVETKPQIIENYIKDGLVQLVRKDMISVGGQKAAEAAHCAGEQGAYWQYHNTLLMDQAEGRPSWVQGAMHRQYATELGLDADALVECFESNRYQAKVNESTAEGRALGGSGTPHFIINGTEVPGAQPFSVFQQIIEAELAAL